MGGSPSHLDDLIQNVIKQPVTVDPLLGDPSRWLTERPTVKTLHEALKISTESAYDIDYVRHMERHNNAVHPNDATDHFGIPMRAESDMPKGIFAIGPDAVTGRFHLMDIEAGKHVTFEQLTAAQQIGVAKVLAKYAR